MDIIAYTNNNMDIAHYENALEIKIYPKLK